MATMDKMMAMLDDVTFWVIVNVILFLYVGIEQLVHGYGPGTYYSAGAVLLAIIYLLLWMWSKTNKKMAYQWIVIISGLAFLGDLIVIANNNLGFFSGTSALLDVALLMLLHSAWKAKA